MLGNFSENKGTIMGNERQINLSTLNGGVEVKLSNGEAVLVKTLSIRKFLELSRALDNECALVELFTGFSPEQVDSLAIEDFEAILQKGKEINYPPFLRWGKRQKETVKYIEQMFADSPIKTEMSGASGANI